MHKQKYKLFSSIIMITLIFNSLASAKELLNVEQFISMAINKNPEFEQILIDNLKIKYNKLLKMPSEEILMGVRSSYSLGDKERPVALTLNKLFLNTGTQANFSYNYNDSYLSDKHRSSFEVVQSVFRNAFGRSNKLNFEKIQKDDEIIKLQIIEAYEKYLYEILSLYYSWTLAYANLELAQLNYNDSVTLFQNMQNKKNSNIVSESDFKKTEIQMLQKQENLENARTEYNKYYNNIRQALRLKINENFTPQTDFDVPEINIDFLKNYQNFKQKSRTYRLFELTGETSLLDLQITKDSISDILNVSAKLSNVEKPNKGLTLGLYYEKAFWDNKNNAIEEIQKIQHNKNLIVISNEKYDIETQLLNLYEDIMLKYKFIKNTENKIQQMEIITKEDQKYYEQGRLSFNDFITSINQLEQYKYEKISRILSLKILMLKWKEVNDVLVKNDEVLK